MGVSHGTADATMLDRDLGASLGICSDVNKSPRVSNFGPK